MGLIKKRKNLVPRISISILPAALLVLTVFIYGPINLYAGNSKELWFPFSFIASKFILSGVGVFLLFSIICVSMPWEKGKWLVALVFGIAVALYIEGTYLPIEYINLNGAPTEWEKYYFQMIWDAVLWTACILVSVAAAGFREELFKKAVPLVCGLLIAVQVIALIPLLNDLGQEKRFVLTSEGKFTLSEKDNIIVLVLDCFDNRLFEMFTEENSQFKQAFSDFTYYRNTTSGFNYTAPSIPFILTGIPYDNSVPYSEYLRMSFRKVPLLKTLYEKGYDSGVYTFPQMIPLNDPLLAEYISNAKSITEEKELSMPMFQSMLKFTALRLFPMSLKKHFLIEYDEFDNPEQEMKIGESTNRDVAFYKHLITQGFATQERENAFRFYHFNGAHLPYTLDGELRPANLEWPQAFFQQAKGCMKLTVTFLDQLKKAGVYDNSTIIIVGDHGVMEDLMMSHYLAPVMLIKTNNRHGEAMSISNAPVSNGDIAATVLDLIAPEVRDSGASIFDVRDNQKRNRYYYWYNGYQKTKSGYLPDLYEYINNGSCENHQDWVRTGRILTPEGVRSTEYKQYRLGTQLYSADITCLMERDKNKKTFYAFRGLYYVGDYAATSGDFAQLCFAIPVRNNDLPVYITLSSAFPDDPDIIQRLRIEVNGKPLADEFYVSGAGIKHIKFTIPKGLLKKDGKLDLKLLLPHARYPEGYQKEVVYLKGALRIYSLTIGAIPPLKKGDVINFGAGGNSTKYIGSGWHAPEPRHRWTSDRAELFLPLRPDKEARLKFRLVYPHDENYVNLSVNGHPIGKWKGVCAGEEWGYYKVMTIPKEVLSADGLQLITLEMPNAYRPSGTADRNARVLGLPVMSIEVID
ncbi:sulfatase [Syntrophothermus lipocalidus DSM 12680]|uniref:Sulfatase n=1 Tax=Syntrophothermus lipocalidus (strain DSM 12680 / TGB-C1) TaxID=643648 RepID=D7CJ80_SYNLT|nr:sulfatase [Syntrophothermus lipocalidus DSM 12680]